MILTRVLDFEAKRNRTWRIVYIRSENDFDEHEFLNWASLKSRKQQQDHGQSLNKAVQCKAWFQGLVYVYYEQPFLKSFFGSKSKASGVYKDLNTYMKEQNDPRLLQQILQRLPTSYSNIFFRERSNDKKVDLAATGLIYSENEEMPTKVPLEDNHWCTSDVIGKELYEMQQVHWNTKNNRAPLIFYLIVGYFRQMGGENMHPVGLFRLAAPAVDVYKFEINMAAGNYSHVAEVTNPHIVSNYLKRLLREMKDPIIPFRQYKAYGELNGLPED